MHRTAWFWVVELAAFGGVAMGQTVRTDIDPAEKPGERPYEMVWAKRTEPAPPTLAFQQLQGWTVEVAGGAQAALEATRAQNVWDRPVARLKYKGDGKAASQPRVTLKPPAPIAVPDGADCVEFWVFGNNWGWVEVAGTPRTRIAIRLVDANGKPVEVQVDTIRWEEWWLIHRKLPTGLHFPLRLEAIMLDGGWQPEWREVFLDSVRFYKEELAPLTFDPRPKRNLTLFPGQSAGANTGPGKLSFPTREETILPPQLAGAFTHDIVPQIDRTFTFRYTGKDARIEYAFDPAAGLDGMKMRVNGQLVGTALTGAAVKLPDVTGRPKVVKADISGKDVRVTYDDGTTLQVRLMGKSLVIDVINRSGSATELDLGQLTGLKEPRTIYVPPITCGGTNPTVLLSKAGAKSVFTSIWMDWYRSNASELWGAEAAAGATARINGGARYAPKTDGKRNPLFERIFLTVSPMFEEVLPTVPNPVGLHAKDAVDRLWQESWGPDDFEKQMKRSRMLRAYGIDKLIQCNHEISWRDNGESFTLRINAAPKKGGDDAQRRYVKHQRGLGWYSGLYTNYTDFSPVNQFWSPDAVQRDSSGEWKAAWPRCYAEKPLAAAQFEAKLAPIVAQKYGTNSSYTDVHTAVAPWGYCDMDARVPGAGTFAQTFYAYGELLRNDSRIYGGPIFSEGTYQWLYAGLADGNYGHTYNGHNLATDPLLPVFDLREVHSRECDIGVSWTAQFCDAIPNWRDPAKIDYAIDRFILATLAYGHIGWLVEEEHGIQRTCRSYYMLQQVQARYGLQVPKRIAYWDGTKLRTVSQALALDLPRTRRQLYVEYPSGLKLWLNDHPTENWTVPIPGADECELPPGGWLAYQSHKDGGKLGGLLAYVGLEGGRRVAVVDSDAYCYLDGYGKSVGCWGAITDGSHVVRKRDARTLEIIHISGTGAFRVPRLFGTMGKALWCAVFDQEGRRLKNARLADGGLYTWIHPVEKGLKYVLRLSGSRDWVLDMPPACAPGGTVGIGIGRAPAEVQVSASAGKVVFGPDRTSLVLPATAKIGDVVTVTARSGNDARATLVHVVAPIEWTATHHIDAESTRVDLRPVWLAYSDTQKKPVAVLHTPEGWTAKPDRIDLSEMSKVISANLTSTALEGAQGDLEVTVEGLGVPVEPAKFHLKRVAWQPVVTDLRTVSFNWGIAFRGKPEGPEPGGTGAVCYTSQALSVGGVSKPGIFMHPPYNGGVGYTWADFGPIALPAYPCELTCSVGIMDGGDKSDGVAFSVVATGPDGKPVVVGKAHGDQGAWRELKADLTAFAGKRVTLRLVADCGPADNTTTDWAAWGDVLIRRAAPAIVTEVTPAK